MAVKMDPYLGQEAGAGQPGLDKLGLEVPEQISKATGKTQAKICLSFCFVALARLFHRTLRKASPQAVSLS